MNTLSTFFDCLTALDANSDILQRSARIELKRLRTGHYRLFIALPLDANEATVAMIRTILDERPVTVNAFSVGASVSSVTLVHHAERAS